MSQALEPLLPQGWGYVLAASLSGPMSQASEPLPPQHLSCAPAASLSGPMSPLIHALKIHQPDLIVRCPGGRVTSALEQIERAFSQPTKERLRDGRWCVM
eukprot:Blabericola_migrator_1__762@NODE_118_length_13653_cov_35_432504_g106_i0_p11_GENE_NODE_118_length_13653_cov_35_432504_g106_i0NODE_118_length_13653_cov_35_432504_g106_i0_p11_ORF_typecomplete_len100_score10_72_NODE_118_length_13653_cov_35_432504_g106_i050365335